MIRIIGANAPVNILLLHTSDQNSTTLALKNHRDAIPLNLLHDIFCKTAYCFLTFVYPL